MFWTILMQTGHTQPTSKNRQLYLQDQRWINTNITGKKKVRIKIKPKTEYTWLRGDASKDSLDLLGRLCLLLPLPLHARVSSHQLSRQIQQASFREIGEIVSIYAALHHMFSGTAGQEPCLWLGALAPWGKPPHGARPRSYKACSTPKFRKSDNIKKPCTRYVPSM
jgi:hypothetical protein